MKTVKIGSVGLGRLGYEHAKNIATRVPGAELTAICDVAADRVREVAEELGVKYQYTDFAEMCANPELDAIAIVSPSMFHGEQIKMALDAGKHVFCDKPLDTTVEKCKLAEKAVEAHPDKVFMLGFMRRYDPSYVKAKAKLDNGDIGRVILVRSYTQDPRTTIEGTLKFAPHSGGQFLDMCVHDIDLVRWFTGSEPKNVWGIGGVFEFELYRELNDGDNVACMMQCENEAMAFMFAGRASAHGCNVETEIVGTRGTLRIASVGTDSMLEVMSKHGVCRECYPDFLARWHEAYTNEMIEFVSCIREGRKPEVTVYDGTAVSEIAYRCKESFECGEMLPLRD
ncbi:Gfo/Idh/MocA family oxidoreductase [Intestinibacillus massiliensis]|uniref:Gfo/Idh/MocA family oxidoreductase n=1 Tax=Intestinibacillus massiliensis TaxID=1871029 RepID=UPI000B34F3F4|nr:Gfo/Idh/MocA family oxidoreductase [Intestinibacillus massiliensis]